MKKVFPKLLFVSIGEDGDSIWFDAHKEPIDAIDDDGPTIVARYELKEMSQFSKQLAIKPIRKKRK